MAGRYGGEIKRRGQPSAWRVSVGVMEAIGREALPYSRGKRSRQEPSKPKGAPT